jgi:hypothetical protein
MSKTIITFWRLWVGKLPSLLLLVTSRLPSRGVELLVPVAVLHAFDSTAGAETLYNNAHHPRFHTVTADWQGTESVTGHPLLYSHGATAVQLHGAGPAVTCQATQVLPAMLVLAQEQSLQVSFVASFDPIPSDCKVSAFSLDSKNDPSTACHHCKRTDCSCLLGKHLWCCKMHQAV